MLFEDPAINRRIQWVVMNAIGDYQVMQGNPDEEEAEQEHKESNDADAPAVRVVTARTDTPAVPRRPLKIPKVYEMTT